VALDSEIERIRKDTDQWRMLASRLLKYAEQDALSDWELDFLENILSKKWLDELSYRRGESLLVIRDDLVTVSSYRGSSVKYLAQMSYENRFDLDDDEEEAWLVELYQSGRTSIRTNEARRLWRLAVRVGVIESDWSA
jgi:hypothetical protein